MEDKTLPEPHVVDDGETWEVIEDCSQFEDVAAFADGQCGENAASFETAPTVGYVLALEPDGSGTEDEIVELAEVEPSGEFPPVDADLIEQQVRRDALQQEVIAVTGGRPPPGWRGDRFPPIRRHSPTGRNASMVEASANHRAGDLGRPIQEGPGAPPRGRENRRPGGLRRPRAATSCLAPSQSQEAGCSPCRGPSGAAKRGRRARGAGRFRQSA